MSQLHSYTIQCPKCEQEQAVALYDSVNVSESPEMKHLLLSNQINSVTCEQCAFAFRIDKPLLYNDPEQKIMIYWMPGATNTSDLFQDDFQQALQEIGSVLPNDIETPDVHLVIKRTELVERIFLLENNLDPRIIEYIKYVMYTKNPQRLNPTQKALLFNAEDSTDEKLLFVVQDIESCQLEGLLEYSQEAYETLVATFDEDERTAHLLEMFPGPYFCARDLLVQDVMESEA